MMVFSPGIIGQVAWFILIDKTKRRAAIYVYPYKARACWRFHAFLPLRQRAIGFLSINPTAGDRAFRTAPGWPSCRMLGFALIKYI
jgi:hypothetical protein